MLALPIVLHFVSWCHGWRDIPIGVFLQLMLEVRCGRGSQRRIWLPRDHRWSSENLEFSGDIDAPCKVSGSQVNVGKIIKQVSLNVLQVIVVCTGVLAQESSGWETTCRRVHDC